MAGATGYTVEERGASHSFSYRVFFRDSTGRYISPFHDIPLHADGDHFNMIVEIPRWTNAKMEVCKEEELNPIKQDVKKGKLRFVDNVFPHCGYPWNYGAMPQTWEDPSEIDKYTQAKGDNDPIDVCEIGSKVQPRGAVVRVKAIGVLGLIDEGESDWKVIAIDVNDPLASQLNDIDDIERLMPGLLKATVEWFKFYKVPTGKPENKFAFDGQVRDRALALQLIQGAHDAWKRLMSGESQAGGIKRLHTTLQAGGDKISDEDGAQVLARQPPYSDTGATQPPETRNWSFVTEKMLQEVNAPAK